MGWRVHILGLLLGLFAAGPSLAGEKICFGAFANLVPDDDHSNEVVRQTYRELLDRAVDPALQKRWLDAIAETNDPFAEPSDAPDLLVQFRHLEKFRAMLTTLGYSREAMARLLLPEAKSMNRAHARAEEKVEQRLETNSGWSPIVTGDPFTSATSLDGRYLAGSFAGTVWVADLEKRTVVSQLHSQPLDGRVHLAADGKKLILGGDQHVTFYDFDKGRLNFEKTVPLKSSWWESKVSKRPRSFVREQPMPLADGHWMVAELTNGPQYSDAKTGLFAFDTRTGDTRRISGTGSVQPYGPTGTHGRQWVVAPGTNQIFTWSITSLWRTEVGADGRAGERRKVLPFDTDNSRNPRLWASQNFVVASDDRQGPVIATGNGERQLKVSPPGTNTTVTNVIFHPDGKTVLVNFNGEAVKVDMETLTVLGTTRVPSDAWYGPEGNLYYLFEGKVERLLQQ